MDDYGPVLLIIVILLIACLVVAGPAAMLYEDAQQLSVILGG